MVMKRNHQVSFSGKLMKTTMLYLIVKLAEINAIAKVARILEQVREGKL
jgi:hypothetical protein